VGGGEGVDRVMVCVDRQVRVLGRLSVVPEERLSASARRAIAYLAVKGPVVQRSLMSMALWPSVLDTRARANLRRAIWQIPAGWVRSTSWEVRLEADVDLIEARSVADLAVDSASLDAGQIDLLTRDLLPGWYDEWLLDEQDAFHLIRLQGLEAMCRTATRQRQFCLATRAGLAAVSAEPLRQSAVVALMLAHLEEGNEYEALRRYEHYRCLLRDELGVEPSLEVTSLVGVVADGLHAMHHAAGDTADHSPV
jgi:DNA-binding SARP family transcriptional activator